MILLRPRVALTTPSEPSIILDATRAPDGYVYSDGDRTAINVSGGANQGTKWAVADNPVPSDGVRRYWEIAVGGGNVQYNGYMGVVAEADREKGKGAGTIFPGDGLGVAYRGDGSVWCSGLTRQTGLPTWGAGAIVMILFRPGTGQFWCGVNGDWGIRPPTNTPAYTTSAGAYFSYVQGRDLDEGGTLRSQAADFSYPVPADSLPLGE